MGSLSVALVGNERQCCCEVHTGCVRDKKGGVAVCYPSLFFYAIILHRGDLMFKMDISRLKLYFYLLFILFISFSFIVVPKERSRKNMKQTKIVDYVLFSRDNREIVTTFLYFPNEDLTYEQWLNKTRSTLEKDNKSTQFNYDEYDKYLEYKNISKYKQSSRYEPYYKVRYDIIARNIIIFGATLASLFIIIKLKQTAK